MAGMEVVKEVKKAEVNGSAQFENGQLKVPVKENGVVSMKTADELKSILSKKDKKQKVGKSAKTNTKQSTKVREKKQANPKFRDDFATKAVEQIQGLERKNIGDKVLLKYKKFTLARLMLRTYGFCAYRKALDGSRMTLKVNDDKTSKELLDWLSKRVEHLKSK